MRRSGTADLPLHGGHCPKWLFPRMKELGAAIAEAIVLEFGQEEFLKRLADPFFFQSLGCVLGFDWHSSGLTTTTLGALKEGLSGKADEIGLAICGGKGRASRKTPAEIAQAASLLGLSDSRTAGLIYSSRMSAKVDSAAVQDGYQLYHHVFLFTERGEWCVIQQGMNPLNRYARRYHWISSGVRSFVEEPHYAICSGSREESVLNMVAKESADCRKASVDALGDIPSLMAACKTVKERLSAARYAHLSMPAHHDIRGPGKSTIRTLEKVAEANPGDYEELLAQPGVGPACVRALALVAEVIYGSAPSWEDPAKFSFAHGGKDGHPYPVERKTYDRSIEVLRAAIDNARAGNREKLQAMRRLEEFVRL